MNIVQMPLGPLGTNCYIVHTEGKALIFDPGGDSEKVINYLMKENVKPLAVLLTHAHFDHIGAVETLRNHYEIPVYLNEKEHDWLIDPNLNGSGRFGMPEPIKLTKTADFNLSQGRLNIDMFNIDIRETPGHSPGSVSFVFEDEDFVIAGDALFQGSIGRTDLPGGDHQLLINSIQESLLSLKETMTVCPGHGPATTIGQEKKTNPFLT